MPEPPSKARHVVKSCIAFHGKGRTRLLGLVWGAGDNTLWTEDTDLVLVTRGMGIWVTRRDPLRQMEGTAEGQGELGIMDEEGHQLCPPGTKYTSVTLP